MKMEQIELVVKMPRYAFDKIKEKDSVLSVSLMYVECMHDAIKNGTILPKGHGRLIDESKIDYLDDDSERPFTFKDRIKNTSETIVEADEEGEDEELKAEIKSVILALAEATKKKEGAEE